MTTIVGKKQKKLQSLSCASSESETVNNETEKHNLFSQDEMKIIFLCEKKISFHFS